jgi:DNA-binding HxlR family transcriptional regulator
MSFDHGLIKRTVHTSKPPLKVDYELTDFGKTLIPLLKSISQWGMEAAKVDERVRLV